VGPRNEGLRNDRIDKSAPGAAANAAVNRELERKGGGFACRKLEPGPECCSGTRHFHLRRFRRRDIVHNG